MTRGLLSRSTVGAALAAAVAGGSLQARSADVLDDIGLTLLHSPGVQPTLTGTGIVVATVEASNYDASQHSLNDFEITPDSGIAAPITYVNSSGVSATGYPNGVGTFSSHAIEVGRIFAGYSGASTGVAQVYNFEAFFFINHIVNPDPSFSLDANVRVINQSFVFDSTDQYDLVNQLYDNFVNSKNRIVVSAIGNGPLAGMTQVQLPATAYNVISVGALGINPGSTGTSDGRTKVDITAPGIASSYTTPLVSGVATILAQAGTLGLAGAGTQAASLDPRTVKSLLMAGAVKTNTWSATTTNSLDPQMGAGILNAYSSYRILTGGKYNPSSRSTVAVNKAHPAVTTGAHVGILGWGLQNSTSSIDPNFTISSSITTDGVDHYVLDVPSAGKAYILSATLVWNRKTDTNLNDTNWSKLNNLDLFLYSGATAISSSTSTIDNVENIYNPTLTAGTYDLQVLKHGGFMNTANVVTNTETYALSWSVSLLGDTNWDGMVDIVDLTNVTSHWQTAQRSVFNGDLNGDGFVDMSDFNIVAANWQSGSSGTPLALPSLLSLLPTAVPEPSTLLLVGLAAPLLLRRNRRRAEKNAPMPEAAYRS